MVFSLRGVARSIATLATIFAFVASLAPVALGQYDEIADKKGKIRDHYVGPIAALNEARESFEANKAKLKGYVRGDTFESWFARISTERFGGENALDPLPMVLTQEDGRRLKDGVRQQARALRLFLEDLHSGRRSFEKAGIFPPGFLNRILERHNEAVHVGKVPTDQIAFTYGPDIIRGPDGSFYKIEDNLGYLGGFGDLEISRKLYFDLLPEARGKVSATSQPDRFYRELAAAWRKQAEKFGGGEVVFWTRPSRAESTEELRLAKALGESGVILVTPYSKHRMARTKNGIELVTKNKDGSVLRRKVGFVFIYGEIDEIALDSRPKVVSDLMRKLEATLRADDLSKRKRQARTALLEEARSFVARAEANPNLWAVDAGVQIEARLREAAGLENWVNDYARMKDDLPAAIDTLIENAVDTLADEDWLEESKPADRAELRKAIAEARRLVRASKGEIAAYRSKAMRDVAYRLEKATEIYHLYGKQHLAVERRYPRGILEAVNAGQVGSSHVQGLGFIDDKQFYLYSDALVEFYTGSKPIIRTIPTESFASYDKQGKPRLRQDVLDKAFDPKNPKPYVIKRVDGRGGDAVWLKPKMKQKDWLALKDLVVKQPEVYIMQGFLELSEWDASPGKTGEQVKIGDVRVMSWVGGGTEVIGEAWSRSSAKAGSGKVNVSTGDGAVRPVFIEAGPMGCMRNFFGYER